MQGDEIAGTSGGTVAEVIGSFVEFETRSPAPAASPRNNQVFKFRTKHILTVTVPTFFPSVLLTCTTCNHGKSSYR